MDTNLQVQGFGQDYFFDYSLKNFLCLCLVLFIRFLIVLFKVELNHGFLIKKLKKS